MEDDKRKFEFIAVSWGDGDGFVFQVDYENFVKITGREPEEWEHLSENNCYRLYPDEVFPEGKKLKIKIEVEDA